MSGVKRQRDRTEGRRPRSTIKKIHWKTHKSGEDYTWNYSIIFSLNCFRNSNKKTCVARVSRTCCLKCVSNQHCLPTVTETSHCGCITVCVVRDCCVFFCFLWHVAYSKSVWRNTAANVYMLLGAAVRRITQTNTGIRRRDNATHNGRQQPNQCRSIDGLHTTATG